MALSDLMVKIGVNLSDFDNLSGSVDKKLRALEMTLRRSGRALTRAISLPLAGMVAGAMIASDQVRSKFVEFGQKVKGIFGQLGDSLFKAMNLEDFMDKIAGVLSKVVYWFDNLSESAKNQIVLLGMLVIAIGPLLVALYKLVAVVEVLFNTFTSVFKFIMTPHGAIIVGLALLGLGIFKLAGGFDMLKKWFENTFVGLSDVEKKARDAKKALDDLAGWGSVNTTKAGRAGPPITLPRPPLVAPGTKDLRMGMWDQAFDLEKITYAENQIWKMVQSFQLMGKSLKQEISPIIDSVASKIKIMADAIAKSREQVESIVKSANQNVANIYKSSELYGGGVNTIEGELQQRIQQYNELMNSGMRETDGLMVQIRGRIEALQSPVAQLVGLFQTIPRVSVQIAQGLFSVFQTFTSGIATAFANFIVYQENLGKALKDLMKQIAASIISTLIQIAIQWLALRLIGLDTQRALGASAIGVNVARAGTAAYAASIETMGLLGLIAGGPIALGAIAAAEGIALIGGAAGGAAGSLIGLGELGSLGAKKSARGAIFMKEDLTRVAEKEPEMVLSKRQFQSFLGLGAGGGTIIVPVYLKNREIARGVAEDLPGVLIMQGIK